jgi:hypothetical protein
MCVYCIDCAYNVIWEADVGVYRESSEDGAHVGTYSGDGELFGVTITHLSTFTLIVLNSHDGTIANVIHDCRADGIPFEDKTVLSESGRVVHFVYGRVVANLGNAMWWRESGA